MYFAKIYKRYIELLQLFYNFLRKKFVYLKPKNNHINKTLLALRTHSDYTEGNNLFPIYK